MINNREYPRGLSYEEVAELNDMTNDELVEED